MCERGTTFRLHSYYCKVDQVLKFHKVHLINSQSNNHLLEVTIFVVHSFKRKVTKVKEQVIL